MFFLLFSVVSTDETQLAAPPKILAGSALALPYFNSVLMVAVTNYYMESLSGI
jgi:hypothetical protein